MAVFEWLVASFVEWLKIFAAPFTNLEMLWVIIPIYLSWFFTEIYQEKKGTSFGNAISNGVIVLWVGVDWLRTLFRLGETGTNFWIKLGIAAVALAYGFMVIILGIRAKKIIHYIGRIRVITYLLIMFTPMFYQPKLFDTQVLIGIVIFAPIFYLVVAIIDWILPDPKVYDYDEGKVDENGQPKMDEFKQDFNKPLDFNQPADFNQPTDKPADFSKPMDFSQPAASQPAKSDILKPEFFTNTADKGDPFGPQASLQPQQKQSFQQLNDPNYNHYKNYQ